MSQTPNQTRLLSPGSPVITVWWRLKPASVFIKNVTWPTWTGGFIPSLTASWVNQLQCKTTVKRCSCLLLFLDIYLFIYCIWVPVTLIQGWGWQIYSKLSFKSHTKRVFSQFKMSLSNFRHICHEMFTQAAEMICPKSSSYNSNTAAITL